ncbi:hypothetical protein [Bacillus thuringiensis]|uniref:hypothetical protein n=1 Tax=Bacillus thuringiensis TaxID=1428 RepID=UPI000BFB30EB|nr:hypothetical protein [Bacillus thuringiensis]PGS67606.1 hypothetical protein COD07_19250 [Bacillus thuringiensis]
MYKGYLKVYIYFKAEAFVTSFAEIVKLLPSGYVIDVRGEDYQRFFKLPITNIGISGFKSAREEIAWFKENANNSGHFEHLGCHYFLGYFVVKKPTTQQTTDKRLSKDILKEILKDCYLEDSIRKKMTFKMNGIINSLNNKAPSQFEEFYRLFRERLIGEKVFERIMQHEDFEIFMINKINELIAKRNK